MGLNFEGDGPATAEMKACREVSKVVFNPENGHDLREHSQVEQYLLGNEDIHTAEETGVSPALRLAVAETIDALVIEGSITEQQSHQFLGRIGLALPDGQPPLALGKDFVLLPSQAGNFVAA